MTAETKPVDVLAVLDRVLGDDSHGFPNASLHSSDKDALREARVAVAELIEVLSNLVISHEVMTIKAVDAGAIQHYPIEHMDRARILLARIGGGA